MGAQEKSQANSNSMQRVKVYRLNEDGKWDDQGTGHVTVDYLERSEELGLLVIDEEDNETLLLHRIIPDDIYRKQEETIISWRDPEYSTDLALSFQETTGCSYIWDHICNAQRNLQFSNLNNETFHSINSDLRDLPAVELSALPLILKTVSESGIAEQMRLTELILNDQDFFRKLMDLFRICEDLENLDGLHMIFKIVKGIILLNSPQIFEKIFADELIMDIIGSLEYDPEVSHAQHHRDFLKEHVVFKEAIPIKDPIVLSKIHQTYRVRYLKDVVLARVLYEATVANLNSIIHANNAVIVSSLKDDSNFIKEVFARLRSPNTSAESKKDLVYFLHEFCSLSKSLQMVHQLRLFRDLMNEGIFDIMMEAFENQDKKLVLTGTDILILFLNQDSNLLRSYVVRQEGIPLLGLLVKGMITDFGEDMHCQFLEILRSLLDSYTLSGAHAQRDNIIEIFYENHLGQLIDVITASCPVEVITQSSGKSSGSGGRDENQNSVKPEILSNICELLCFCVLHHPYMIKCNFLLNNVIDKVLTLTRRREKYLVVAAVRFVRTILSRHENLKLLIKYVVDSFWNELVKFEHLASIQSFKVKYEQCLEHCATKNGGSTFDSRKRIDERALEKEEEEYFNEDSDEEDTASASHAKKVQPQPVLANGVSASYPSLSSRSGGLVDYDDEDDEDYRPPPKKQLETLEDDEGTMESLKLKRKLPSREKEAEQTKKQRLGKPLKSRDSVFASLCSTLSQAVLPSKKAAGSVHSAPRTTSTNKGLNEENRREKEPAISRSCCNNSSHSGDENIREKESAAARNCCDCLQSTSENRQLSVEDGLLIAQNSSPEMAVNGS
ncbi:serine/threonine-protein phosphatase 4 regulatory subunit 3A isoform X2 [Manihot esculenta]|uniref:serine/threonine-protein phosphatase 4 regulatory subunit 3A isoform X2 n=1 Tax=Manihot esculenta TaxID=3983 RepID=UPI001CC58494|nr:serine/threonine-protein phosphatase 4 regulatory subunit 3A isoform X2 [Manihot esculenta]